MNHEYRSEERGYGYGGGGGYGGGRGGQGGQGGQGGHGGGGRGGYGGGRGGQGGHGGGRGGPGGGGHYEDRPHRERRGMPLSELDPNLTESSRKVIGAAIEVHKALGPGYTEAAYMAALKIEMDALGIAYKVGHSIPVKYKEQTVAETTADLFVDSRFLVELMARPGDIGSFERSQLRAQLKAADLELGLIINFAERRLKDGLVRVLNIEKLNAGKEGFDDHGHEEGEDDHGEADPARGMDFDERH
ncbi:MAG: GxxExxY protein [Phycisphaerales bacterium]|nr:GxxExxY protein [Phycisphaerales bacterium]